MATPPPVPTGVSRPALVDEWRELWASPIAATITVTDLPALSRLFRLKQQFDAASVSMRFTPNAPDGSHRGTAGPGCAQSTCQVAPLANSVLRSPGPRRAWASRSCCWIIEP